ncbi:hypothetical protein RJ55_03372 [Drechmeria coniospora]|nr:hypothetical protein RJ55_03372 [Drechmeria coniospora]
MADLRQLALDFVLEDDQTKLEISTSPANTNPIARWVEAVQPWMPGTSDEAMQDDPDWTGRSKALEFLSQTLQFLSPNVLKAAQIKLLVSFFGAMFDVDHKAGIKASATALYKIVGMEAFQPQNGHDIIRKTCALGDDFPRQLAATRLAVFELLRLLITDQAVARDLQRRDDAAGFMSNLLHLCQNERDPDCLMVWFDILSAFLQDFPSPPQEVTEEVFGAFKAYFPITLPRTSQSRVDPQSLKLALRQCFASNDRLAPLSLPFLIGKLDQGDGVTVNVKLDILHTIDMCLEKFAHTEQSIAPYVNSVWGSLKYEVRNGDVEDTIAVTLQVMRTLTTRLEADLLRDFTLTVTRDCLNDLSNPVYTAAAGRLLVSVLSASTTAFVLVVAPTITHIKENLRHPKSPRHGQDLQKILHIILETRLLLRHVDMTDQERSDFSAVDPIFKSLYAEVYKAPLELAIKDDPTHDDIKLSTVAVQGASALIRQWVTDKVDVQDGRVQSDVYLLLPEATCTEVCDALFIILQRQSLRCHRVAFDELVNETISALQRAVLAYPRMYNQLVKQSSALIRKNNISPDPEAVGAATQRLCSILAVVGFSNLRPSPTNGARHFVNLISTMSTDLFVAMDVGSPFSTCFGLVSGIMAMMQYFHDACGDLLAGVKQSPTEVAYPWLSRFMNRYQALERIGVAGSEQVLVDEPYQTPEFRNDATIDKEKMVELQNDGLLVAMHVCRLIYRRATKAVESPFPALGLSDDFSGVDKDSENQYLHQLSRLARLVILLMGNANLSCPNMETWFLTLFRDETVPLPPCTSNGSASCGMNWNWLVSGPLGILSAAVLQNLQQPCITRLYDMGVAQSILLDGTSSVSAPSDPIMLSSTRSILANLANKHGLEANDDLMAALERHLKDSLDQATTGLAPRAEYASERAVTIYVVIGALVQRCTGEQTQGLLKLLFKAPNDLSVGDQLARGMEHVIAYDQVYGGLGSMKKALWKQKLWYDLVEPMVNAAIGMSQDIQTPLLKSNYGIAALHMARSIPFSIYEDDADKLVRVALSVAADMDVGADALAAINVLNQILEKAPELMQGHLRSLINVCISLVSDGRVTNRQLPAWMPESYGPANTDGQTKVECGQLAVNILEELPQRFEPRHLVPFSRMVKRELSVACGHLFRDVRKHARLAKSRWDGL